MVRMRRLRVNETMRRLVRETSVSVDDLVYPVFVTEGSNIKNEVDSMPGIYQWSIDRLDEELDRIVERRIPAILIFGIPDKKDEVGSEAYRGIIGRGFPPSTAIQHGMMVEAVLHQCGGTTGNKLLELGMMRLI